MFNTLDRLTTVMRKKGYSVFESSKPCDVNLVGIRSSNVSSNKFDDQICVFYNNGNFQNVLTFKATTDPGAYWLEHPMHAEGTAILVPGQYRGAFKIGKHQGKYPALVQAKELPVYRDNDGDTQLDTDNMIIDTGFHGINIHCAKHAGTSIQVDKWSAGCQVIADWYDFQIFMAIMYQAKETYGDSFTYTLIKEEDLL